VHNTPAVLRKQSEIFFFEHEGVVGNNDFVGAGLFSHKFESEIAIGSRGVAVADFAVLHV
jgi:hypothetical protein